MAANTVVKNQSAVDTQLDDEVLNPDVNAATGGAKTIFITLRCNGVNVDIGTVFDSLKTIGADVSAVTPLVTVASDKDVNTHGNYIFDIGPV